MGKEKCSWVLKGELNSLKELYSDDGILRILPVQCIVSTVSTLFRWTLHWNWRVISLLAFHLKRISRGSIC